MKNTNQSTPPTPTANSSKSHKIEFNCFTCENKKNICISVYYEIGNNIY